MKKKSAFIFTIVFFLINLLPLAAETEALKISTKDFYILCTEKSMEGRRQDLFESDIPLRIIITDKIIDSEKFMDAIKSYTSKRPLILDLQNVEDSTRSLAFESIYGNIKEIYFPENYLGYSFDKMKKLEKIHLSRKQKEIFRYQFQSLPNLREIIIPENSELKKIEWLAFNWTSGLEKINIPPSCKSIESQTFKGMKNLKDVDLSNVDSLGKEAFSGCISLEHVTVGKKVNDIGGIFNGCTNIRDITFLCPDIKFNDKSFSGMINLETINLPEGSNYFIQDGVLMDKDKRTIVFALPKCKTETFRIPDTVIKINSNAFSANTSIKKITNVPDLQNQNQVFSNLKSLEEIEYRNNVSYPGKNYTFLNCTNLKTFKFPKGTISPGKGFFSGCTRLDNIILPDGMNYPEGLESWPDEYYSNFFYGCTSLKNLTLPADIPEIYSFMFCKSGIEKIFIPDSVTVIRSSAFEECEKLSEISLSSNLKIIKQEAFKNCTSLSKIDLPPSLTVIENGAFKGCTNLTCLELPESVKQIGNEFIAGSGIETLVIPKGIKKLTTDNFINCPSLKLIQFAGTVEEFKSVYEYFQDGEALDIKVSCKDRDFNLLELTKFYTVEELKKLH